MGENAASLTPADIPSVAMVVIASILGVVSLAACVTGYLKNSLSVWGRGLLGVAAVLLMMPAVLINLVGGILFGAMLVFNNSFGKTSSQEA